MAFRHDLCRMAIGSVIPPGAEAGLHRRLLDAYEATSHVDPAVLTHHALGADDVERTRRAACDAGVAAARSGAHTQAAEFFTTALESGAAVDAHNEAELLELLAGEFYLIDRLDDAITSCRRAMRIRQELGESAAVSADHHSLSVYSGTTPTATSPKGMRRRRLPCSTPKPTTLSNSCSSVRRSRCRPILRCRRPISIALTRSSPVRREIAYRTGDSALTIRVRLIEGIYGVVLNGDDSGREEILRFMRVRAEAHRRDLFRRVEQHHLSRRRAAAAGRRCRPARHQPPDDAWNTICRSAGSGNSDHGHGCS